MGQTNIFDYIKEEDALLEKIKALQYSETFTINKMTIVKYKFYEVLHEDFHEMFKTVEEIYRFIDNDSIN